MAIRCTSSWFKQEKRPSGHQVHLPSIMNLKGTKSPYIPIREKNEPSAHQVPFLLNMGKKTPSDH